MDYLKQEVSLKGWGGEIKKERRVREGRKTRRREKHSETHRDRDKEPSDEKTFISHINYSQLTS